MSWIRARRANRIAAADREATEEAWEIRRIALQPERPSGDPLMWPLPAAPAAAPSIFDALACPAVATGGARCEKRRGHRVKAHGHALEVDDVLDVRVNVWREAKASRSPLSADTGARA